MKMLLVILVTVGFISCETQQKTPSQTAQIVVESFYQNDFKTLKKYTTEESYEAFFSIQGLLVPNEPASQSNFKLIDESINEAVAWVKFTTGYEEKPETFKLILRDNKWIVTEKKLSEKSPLN